MQLNQRHEKMELPVTRSFSKADPSASPVSIHSPGKGISDGRNTLLSYEIG